jgi:hypothetical protein
MADPFTEDVKLKCLLWSDRHCCLCEKACGTDIEIAHIDEKEKGGNNIDNAIPLCYECHAKIGRYRSEHPKGNKYRPKELKARREQIYERHTLHLVPPIELQVTQRLTHSQRRRMLPDVGFNLIHHGDSHPVKVRVEAKVKLGDRDLGMLGGHYGGEKLWNLNPRYIVFGHRRLPKEVVESDERLEIDVTITIIDEYEREHKLLPMGYVYVRDGNYWFAEPSVT